MRKEQKPEQVSEQKKIHYPAHEKELRMLLQYAYSEYKHIEIDRHNIQINLVKNYLWLSTVILGVYFSIGVKFRTEIIASFYPISEWQALSIIIGAMACLSAIFALIIGIDTLRGRFDNTFPLGKNFKSLQEASCKSALAGEQFSVSLYLSLIDAVSKATRKRARFVDFTGRRLRLLSRLLVFSACSSCVLCLLLVVMAFVKENNKHSNLKTVNNIEKSMPMGEKNER